MLAVTPSSVVVPESMVVVFLFEEEPPPPQAPSDRTRASKNTLDEFKFELRSCIYNFSPLKIELVKI